MQIVSANIINFGKLSDAKFDFTLGVNQIFENNGYGKTTLMAFIKAMLYGFSNKQKAEREHYAPWNKGVYGGTLVLIAGNTEYRIERIFGSTPSKDSIRIYNNKTLELLDETEVGTKFLGLDEQSFFYTTYINENMLNGEPNSTLIAKLTQLNANEQQDLTNYDRAIKNLEEAKKNIKNSRGGELSQIEEQLNLTNRQIEEAVLAQKEYEQTIPNIELLENKNVENKKNLASFDEQIEKASKGQGTKESRKAFMQITQEQQQLQQELTKQMLVFPLGLPNDNSIETCNEKIIQLKSCSQDISSLQNENFKNIIEDFDEKQNKSNEIIGKQKNASTPTHANKKVHITGIVISSLIVTIGIALSFAFNAILGSILAFIGIIYLIYSIIKTTKKQPIMQDTTLTDLSKLWHTYFASMQEYYDFIAEQKSSIKEAHNKQKELNKLIGEQDKLQDEIKMFFSNFNITYDNFDKAIQDIKLKVIEIKKLDATLAQTTKQLQLFDTSAFNALEDVDINTLKAQKNQIFTQFEQIKQEISALESKRDALMLKAEKYQTLCQTAQKLEERKLELTDKYTKLNYTIQFLELAKQQLGTKYILPTQEKLHNLTQKFSSTKVFNNIRIKDDLSLVYEQDGVLHNENSLSSGLRHTLNLLYRFALAQTIFKDDKICLFLDDAFYCLDEQNLNAIKSIVKELAQDNQIIYFTCSKERVID